MFNAGAWSKIRLEKAPILISYWIITTVCISNYGTSHFKEQLRSVRFTHVEMPREATCPQSCLNGAMCTDAGICDCETFQALGNRCQIVPNTGKERDGICKSWGQYHFETFDGIYYYFPGNCSYIFAKDCSSQVPQYTIWVHNSPHCHGSVYSCPRSITMFFSSQEDIVISGHEVRKGGSRVILPQTIENVFIERLADYILVKTTFGFSLAWDGSSGVYIKLTDDHKGKPCGLCGNFNGNTSDDLIKQNNEYSEDIAQFANSWSVQTPDESGCVATLSEFPSPCPNKELHEDVFLKCQVLLQFPFLSCHESIDPYSYIASCINDLCKADDDDTYCRTVTEYARACSHSGFPIRDWRDDFPACSEKCEDRFVHRDCISCCPPTCTFEKECLGSNLHCLDGCYCPDGLIMDNGTCVPVARCPCIYHGTAYPVGSKIEQECSVCICTGGTWNCTEHDCPAECSVIGDSHFTTFDGRSFTFLGSCQYILVKGTGKDMFTITLQKSPCGQNLDRSCIQSITLVLEDDLNKQATIMRGGEVQFGPNQGVGLLGDIEIRNLSSMFVQLNTRFGLRIRFSKDGERLYIQANSTWKRRTLGLCGTFNGNLRDDFLSPAGMIEGTPQLHANAWKVSSACSNPFYIPVMDPCDTNQQNVGYAAHCELINQDLFAPCHAYVSPGLYFQLCRFDACKCGSSCLCNALAHYTYICGKHGIAIDFRSHVSYCGVICRHGMLYHQCSSSCGRSCSSISTEEVCGPECIEGCNCPDGKYFEESINFCVALSSCRCYYRGRIYQPGEIMPIQSGSCQCLNGTMKCTETATPISGQTCPEGKIHYDCRYPVPGLPSAGVNCEVTCANLAMNFTCVPPPPCASGCVCPPGMAEHKGKCYVPDSCPCTWKDWEYLSGEVISTPCYTCVCRRGIFNCTNFPCPAVCTVYGDRHYYTFDGLEYDYASECQVYLVKSTDNSNVSITAQNKKCFDNEIVCSKSLIISIGDTEIYFSETSEKILDPKKKPVETKKAVDSSKNIEPKKVVEHKKQDKCIEPKTPVDPKQVVDPKKVTEPKKTVKVLKNVDKDKIIEPKKYDEEENMGVDPHGNFDEPQDPDAQDPNAQRKTRPHESKYTYQHWKAGFYTAVHFPELEITILWDKKTTIHVKVGPRWKGRLAGLCGNFDKYTSNDLTTSSNMEVRSAQVFGESWTIGQCRSPNETIRPCEVHQSKFPYAKKECSILYSDVFALCRNVIDVTSFVKNCHTDTCNCNLGGDCECLCTSISAYAHKCCQQGVAVHWRSPHVCPYDCEYYNQGLGEGPYILASYGHRDTVLGANVTSRRIFPLPRISAHGNVLFNFMITPGLFKDKDLSLSLVSLESAERPNYFLYVHDNETVCLEQWEANTAFHRRATFFHHQGLWIPGYSAFELHSKKGFFIIISSSEVKVSNYDNSEEFKRASSFSIEEIVAAVPYRRMCEWRYEPCASPCVKTCSDPEAVACKFLPAVEGCLPYCPKHMILDETTLKCVYPEDCIPIRPTETAVTKTPKTKPTISTTSLEATVEMSRTTISSVKTVLTSIATDGHKEIIPAPTSVMEHITTATSTTLRGVNTTLPSISTVIHSLEPPETTTLQTYHLSSSPGSSGFPTMTHITELPVELKTVVPAIGISTPFETSTASLRTTTFHTSPLQSMVSSSMTTEKKLQTYSYTGQNTTAVSRLSAASGSSSLQTSLYSRPATTLLTSLPTGSFGLDNVTSRTPVEILVTIRPSSIALSHSPVTSTTTSPTAPSSPKSVFNKTTFSSLTEFTMQPLQSNLTIEPMSTTTIDSTKSAATPLITLSSLSEKLTSAASYTQEATSRTLISKLSSTSPFVSILPLQTTESSLQKLRTSTSVIRTSILNTPLDELHTSKDQTKEVVTIGVSESPSITLATSVELSSVSTTTPFTTLEARSSSIASRTVHISTLMPPSLTSQKPKAPGEATGSTKSHHIEQTSIAVSSPAISQTSEGPITQTSLTESLHAAQSTLPSIPESTGESLRATTSATTQFTLPVSASVSATPVTSRSMSLTGADSSVITQATSLAMLSSIPAHISSKTPRSYQTSSFLRTSTSTIKITPELITDQTVVQTPIAIPYTKVFPSSPGTVHTADASLTPKISVSASSTNISKGTSPGFSVGGIESQSTTTSAPFATSSQSSLILTTTGSTRSPLTEHKIDTIPSGTLSTGIPLNATFPAPASTPVSVSMLPAASSFPTIFNLSVTERTLLSNVSHFQLHTSSVAPTQETSSELLYTSKFSLSTPSYFPTSYVTKGTKPVVAAETSELSLLPTSNATAPLTEEISKGTIGFTYSLEISNVTVATNTTLIPLYNLTEPGKEPDTKSTEITMTDASQSSHAMMSSSIVQFGIQTSFTDIEMMDNITAVPEHTSYGTMIDTLVSSGASECMPRYIEPLDRCSQYVCINTGWMLYNVSRNCYKNVEKPDCGFRGKPVQINTDTCCPEWECPCLCSVLSELSIITFDGNNIALYNTAPYILVRLPKETIVAHIEKCPPNLSANSIRKLVPAGGTSGLCFKKLNVTTPSFKVLVNRLSRKVEVNSLSQPLPFSKNGLCIQDTGAMYVINTPAGVSIKWAHVTGIIDIQYGLHSNTSTKTEGLCGICNGDPKDDLKMQNRTIITNMDDIETLIKSWEIEKSGDITTRRPIRNCTEDNCTYCLELLNRSTFAPCHSKVSPHDFCEKMWINNTYFFNYECDALSAYVSLCNKHNICIRWRTPDYCSLVCPEGKEYQACVQPCAAKTCLNKWFYEDSPCSYLREDCVCKNGTILHRTDSELCISEEKCACTDTEGQPRSPGEVWNGSPKGCCMYQCIENGSVIPMKPDCSEEPMPTCEREGEVIINVIEERACCPKKICECNMTLCDITNTTCKAGEKLVAHYTPHSCCPHYQCVCDPFACPNISRPECREDQFIVEVKQDDPCCFSYLCVCESCIEPIPVCSEGEILSVDLNTTQYCCPHYHCACDENLCPAHLVNCSSDAKLVMRRVPEQCCPEWHCECNCENVTVPRCKVGEDLKQSPYFSSLCDCTLYICEKKDVCVFQEVTILHPGQSMIQYLDGDLCYTVQCLRELDYATGFHAMTISTINCTERCESHQIYIPSADHHMCCGTCKNVSCTFYTENGTLDMYQVGSTWVSNCTKYECAKSAVGAMVLGSSVVCPPFNETDCLKNGGIVQTYNDGCCKICKQEEKICQKTLVRTTIRKHDCISQTPINVASCDGKCPSATIFNVNIDSHLRFCKCCREVGVQNLTVPLYCSGNGTEVMYVLQEPVDCSCQWN
ncbi:otogelin-like protein [Lissotriton helveticus]